MGEPESLATSSQTIAFTEFRNKTEFSDLPSCQLTRKSMDLGRENRPTPMASALLKGQAGLNATAVLGNDYRESYKQIRPQIANIIGIINGQLPQTLVGVVGF